MHGEPLALYYKHVAIVEAIATADDLMTRLMLGAHAPGYAAIGMCKWPALSPCGKKHDAGAIW
jgi:hypothetical protein